MDKEQNNKIGVVTASAMVTVAIIFDMIGMIPIVSIVSSVLSCLVFGTWFYFLGAGLVNPKKIATIGIAFLSKIIPFNIIPTTTIGVCAFIFMQNHPAVANLAHKGLNTKKQSLNKQVKGFEKTPKKTPVKDIKPKEQTPDTSGSDKKKTEVKSDINPPLSSTTINKKLENQEVKKTTNTPDEQNKKEPVSKENNSEDQLADYEKNKQDLKNIEYLQGKIPQRRFIKDIDIPAPYGEEDQDELDLAA